MYNVYIIYMYRKTSGMKIKIKEEKKKNRKQLHTHIELVYNGVYKTRVTI